MVSGRLEVNLSLVSRRMFGRCICLAQGSLVGCGCWEMVLCRAIAGWASLVLEKKKLRKQQNKLLTSIKEKGPLG